MQKIEINKKIHSIEWMYRTIEYSEYEGYTIFFTNGEELFFGIDNASECCEDWGILDTIEDVKKYNGAKLIAIEFDADSTMADMPYDGDVYCCFINLITDKGIIYFNVYNAHNGYYGHEVIFRNKDFKVEKWI